MENAEGSVQVVEYLENEMNVLDRTIEECNQKRKYLTELISKAKGTEPAAETRPKQPKTAWDTDLTKLNVNFAHLTNNTQRVFEICEAAHAAGKIIYTNAVADYLTKHGFLNGTPASGRTSVSHVITDSRHYFEPVGKGFYRYHPDGDADVVTNGASFDESSVVQ